MNKRSRPFRASGTQRAPRTATETIQLRIIAGTLRTRKIQFLCDNRTRPMKDRTREALMNLLGGTFEGRWAFDLFGGSGILAFEAVSRGARRAAVWEILRSGATEIRKMADSLGITQSLHVLHTDVLAWSEAGIAEGVSHLPGFSAETSGERVTESSSRVTTGAGELPSAPSTVKESSPTWVVFVCPPYALWQECPDRLRALVADWYRAAPVGSLIAVELEDRTPESCLPAGVEWELRTYAPARLAIAEKETDDAGRITNPPAAFSSP